MASSTMIHLEREEDLRDVGIEKCQHKNGTIYYTITVDTFSDDVTLFVNREQLRRIMSKFLDDMSEIEAAEESEKAAAATATVSETSVSQQVI